MLTGMPLGPPETPQCAPGPLSDCFFTQGILGRQYENTKNRKSFRQENPGNPGTNTDLGPGGVWGTIFIVNFIERFAQKLHRIILLHFGLVTLGFMLGNPNSHFYVFIQIFKNTPRTILENSILRKSSNIGIPTFFGGKYGSRTVLNIRRINFRKSWIWDQSL